MDYDIIVPERLTDAMRAAAFDGPNECGAWTLFNLAEIQSDPWSGSQRRRMILHSVHPLAEDDIVSSGPEHLTVRTASFVPLMRCASVDGQVAGFLHGHPSGYGRFSPTDDTNESALSAALTNRNGPESELVSLLVLPDGQFKARVWSTPQTQTDAAVSITGSHLRIHNRFGKTNTAGPSLDRQARVFGNDFNTALQTLRVLIVGAGGTSSPLAVMLARAGVRRMAIIDPDMIEDTNLHRLHGANMDDIGRSKAATLASYVNGLGIGTHAIGINGNILDADHRDLLKSADVIFCATDDHAGRLLLNRFAYFYETPVIDMGLAIARDETGVKDMTGRVTMLYPGAPCLICRRVVDLQRAREEELHRRDPEAFKRQVKDGYILGGGDPEPAFIAMTTSVACMALEEFAQLIGRFRKDKRCLTQRLRRFQIPEDRCSGAITDADCPVCGQVNDWGAGDIRPFLDRVA